MKNHYIDQGFTSDQLKKEMAEIQEDVRQLGEIYGNVYPEKFSDFQNGAIQLHQDGFEIGDQITDCYAEMGAILEAMKYLEGAVS